MYRGDTHRHEVKVLAHEFRPSTCSLDPENCPGADYEASFGGDNVVEKGVLRRGTPSLVWSSAAEGFDEGLRAERTPSLAET